MSFPVIRGLTENGVFSEERIRLELVSQRREVDEQPLFLSWEPIRGEKKNEQSEQKERSVLQVDSDVPSYERTRDLLQVK